ncbi:AfsR/SARP family transcriptional regulator [Streptomyces sp. WM6378]|uniref:AfsR/SARP family transcriptional regulator n=1 Tax=Streptomyces sp. WM6378 TaxID=1415557 RepID=UPI0006AE1643|nr:AfsR/SARP family transcriptional regulator [Streptomyces sp. WM6378]
MDIDVLGPLGVRVNGVGVMPSAPPVGLLVEELWGERPPRSARTTLQTYVLQLRELIGAALESGAGPQGVDGVVSAKDVLVTAPGGYVLRGGGGSSDVREFDRLAGMGYRAMDADDFAGASRWLREALALWSGSALADVRAGAQLEVEVCRLEEARLCALYQRIEADLRLGRHRELLGELTVLVSRYRTHEALHGQFMLALYRSGRRSEALNVYQRLRQTLVRDLGLEPSAGLRRLQQTMLQACEPTPLIAGAQDRRLARVA